MNEGRLVSSHGLEIPVERFEEHFVEHQEPHSTALHCRLDGKPYLVGPLARLNLNLDRLPDPVRMLVDGLAIRFPSRNMHHSVLARAIEIVIAIREAIGLLENYQEPVQPYVAITPRAGSGAGCTEAPRGLLWHRYETDAHGKIARARIVPPTSQNQSRIEDDLRHSLQDFGLDQGEAALRQFGERVIRNYDPCISCATHFLELRMERK